MRKRLPIFYSALLLTGVNLLLRLAGTTFQVYLSGKIGAEGVGLLQLVLSVGGLSMTAAMAGIRTTAMYLTAEELGKNRPENVGCVLQGCFLYSILCSTTVSLLLFWFSPVIAEKWIGDPQSLGAIRLVALFLPVVCLTGCMSGYFTAANRIGTLAAVEVAEQICSMAVTMTALTLWAREDPGKACQAVILGSSTGALLTFVCLGILRKKETAQPSNRIPVRKRLLSTAVPLALADDLKAGISTAENLMVPKRLALYPSSTAPLAVFGTVCGMVFPVLMFPAAILFSLAELLIPELARCAAAGSVGRIRYLVRKSLRVAAIYGILFSGLLFLCAEDLCAALYPGTEAGKYLKLYAPLVPMLYCDALTDAMTKGLGQQTYCVRYNILTSALDVILLFLLLPKYGMQGYFFSFLITHLLNFLLSLRRLVLTAKIRIPVATGIRMLAAGAVSLQIAAYVPSSSGRIIAYLCLLGSILTLLGVLSGKDVLWIKNLIKK